jgi:hypothetical protein
MASWLSNQAKKIQQNIGKSTAMWGGVASLVAGKDLRVGGGSGLGAKIAGQAKPFFSVSTANAGEPEKYPTTDWDQYQSKIPITTNNPKSIITNTGGGGNSGGNNNVPSDPYQQSQDLVNQNTNDSNSQIDRDYEDSMRMLGDQEVQAQGQAAETGGTLTSEATKVTNQLANQQTVDTQGQEAQLAQGEATAATGLQGARDLFRQTQQNNIAQLSGAGLSSSSVAEALAERLGVETARRIAGITGSLGEIRQNATKEIARIKSYYEGKATEATQWVANEKMKIQSQLTNVLNQIGTAKQMASSAKANARAEALSQQRTQLFQLAQQENQFQNSLKDWAQKKAETTQQLITDPAKVLAYNQNIATLNQAPGITQTNIGNYGADNSGQIGYYANKPLKTSVKKEELTGLENPFGAQVNTQAPDWNRFPNDGYTN